MKNAGHFGSAYKSLAINLNERDQLGEIYLEGRIIPCRILMEVVWKLWPGLLLLTSDVPL
jgi:hypothetical protein